MTRLNRRIPRAGARGVLVVREKSRFEQYVKEVNAYSRKCSKRETCIDRRVDKENSERDKIVYG